MYRVIITENGYGAFARASKYAFSVHPPFLLSNSYHQTVSSILAPNFLIHQAKMNTIQALLSPTSCVLNQDFECGLSVRSPSPTALGFTKLCGVDVTGLDRSRRSLSLYGHSVRLNLLKPIKAKEDYGASLIDECSRESSDNSAGNLKSNYFKPIKAKEDQDSSANDDSPAFNGKKFRQISTFGNSTNILWHEFPIQKGDRQQLLQQRGCVIWLTGLSGSGKSTLACALSRGLHSRGKLSYVLDGDNIRHGLNCDLSFGAEDRSENIRRVGEVAKLFADAGVICITSLISPYRMDRDACRALLPEGDFIEVFIDVPLHVCEARDPKGLYKLARAGKIKGFTGIDDPYEPPHDCEVVLQHNGIDCLSPSDMADKVISYLEENGYLRA